MAQGKVPAHLRLSSKLEIVTMAGNTTAATTQMTQLYPQLFVERLYPTYIAVAINQYVTERVVVIGWFFFFSVAIFISSGRKTAAYDYLEKEEFESEYGVHGMVTERKTQYLLLYT